MKIEQRAITHKISLVGLLPLHGAVPLMTFYPCMKFHVNSTNRIGIISVTKKCDQKRVTDGQTDGRMDGQTLEE